MNINKVLIIVFLVVLLLILNFVCFKKNIIKENYEQKCPVIIKKCRPPFTTRFYFHFIQGWEPIIKDKKLDFYFKSSDFVEKIFNNVRNIWKNSNINFDGQKTYYENANDNLAYYYSNDINRDLEFKSIAFNLQHADPVYHKSIIKESLVSLTDPFKREKQGFHIYFFPYIGKDSIAKTVYIDDFPVIFVGLYTEDIVTNKIKRTIDIIPKFKENMEISKIIAKHLGYLFGLSYSIESGNLMNTYIDDNIIVQFQKHFANNDINRINQVMQNKFDNLSKYYKQKIFSQLLKFSSFDYLKENSDIEDLDKIKIDNTKTIFSSCKKLLKGKFHELFKNNKDLAYICGEKLGMMFAEYFMMEELNLDDSLNNNSQLKLLIKLKSKNNVVEFTKSIKGIFERLNLKHLSIILSQLFNYTSVFLNDNQINLARQSAIDNKAKLNDSYKLKEHYMPNMPSSHLNFQYSNNKRYQDVIGPNAPPINNVYKAFCHSIPKHYPECLTYLYRLKEKTFMMDDESKPKSKEEIYEYQQMLLNNNTEKECTKKESYMDKIKDSFI